MPSGLPNFPSINELLESPPLKSLVDRVNPTRMMTSVRSFVDGMRQELQTAVTQRQIPSPMVLAEQIAQWITRQEQAGVRNVLNATGVLLHPELGGAPLADEALAALRATAGSYSRVPAAGTRPTRVEQLLQKLTGCEAAIVVANPALAVALVTNVLACGQDVLIPRSQMVTAVDGTRAFELIAAAGGRLCEVGAVNELLLADLDRGREAAFAFWQQGLPLEVTGHQQSIELSQMATWAQRHSLPLIVDLGLGGLYDVSPFGLEQSTASAAIQAGAAAVILRGDGLLGGPSCAVIAAKSSLIGQLVAHPLLRTAGCDKAAMAAFEATLELYQTAAEQQPSSIERAIPLLSLLATSADNLKHRCERLAPQLSASPALAAVEPLSGMAHLSAAKLSNERLDTWGLALQPAQGTAADLLIALSNTTPAVIGGLSGDRVWLDLRGISPREDQLLVQAIQQLPAAK
jgi:L-seryl-tRNA(Ser) seleniumtransferase